MTSYQTSAEIERLNILDYDVEKLRQAAESGGVLYWNHGGLVGKVPNAVLRDTLSVYDDYVRLRERHPDAVPPQDAGVIRWEQTVTPRTSSGHEEAPLLPLRR
jgi:hypothetical protein